jgi:hypothetical protein
MWETAASQRLHRSSSQNIPNSVPRALTPHKSGHLNLVKSGHYNLAAQALIIRIM